MLLLTISASRTFSIRIPQIFRSPTQMSLGHLMRASMPRLSRKSRRETVVSSVISSTSLMLSEYSPSGGKRRSRLKVRPVPGREYQVWVPCPLPAVCVSAAMIDKLSSEPILRLTSLLVESAVCSHIMPPVSEYGVIFVVSLSANL